MLAKLNGGVVVADEAFYHVGHRGRVGSLSVEQSVTKRGPTTHYETIVSVCHSAMFPHG